MTLTGTDMKLYLTNPAATAGGTTAQADPANSRGEFISTTEIVSAALGALFSTVTAAQASAGYTDYRAIGIRNSSATDDMLNAVVWLDDPAGGGTYNIQVDPAGIKDYLSGATVQGTDIAAVTTAPSGVTFGTVPIAAAPLSLGTLAPGKARMLWVRRVIAAGTPGTSADDVDIVVRAETT